MCNLTLPGWVRDFVSRLAMSDDKLAHFLGVEIPAAQPDVSSGNLACRIARSPSDTTPARILERKLSFSLYTHENHSRK